MIGNYNLPLSDEDAHDAQRIVRDLEKAGDADALQDVARDLSRQAEHAVRVDDPHGASKLAELGRIASDVAHDLVDHSGGS